MSKRDPKTGRYISSSETAAKKVVVKLAKGGVKSTMSSQDPFSFGVTGQIQSQVDFATETGRRGAETVGLGSGPSSTSLINMSVARRRSRHAVLTNGYAKRAVDILVANVVGSGHRLISEAPNAEFKKQIEALWQEWQHEASADPGLNYAGIESLAFRSMLEGGDCFIRMRTRRPDDNMSVPLKLQIFESEQVPVTKNETFGMQSIIGGIQFDALGQPVFYHMHTNHPGEFSLINLQGAGGLTGGGDTKAVPARDIVHLHDIRRPNDVRGLPVLSQALITLSDLDRYMDAELVRKKAAALIGGFIHIPADNLSDNPFVTGDEDEDEFHIEALEPGSFPILPPGYDVRFSDPADVGINFREFLKQILHMIAASINITFEQLTQDLSGVNDRVIRASMLEFKRIAQQYQRLILQHQFHRRVFNRFFDLAIISGALAIPAGMTEREARKVRWIADPWDYLNPLQDVTTKVMEVRAGAVPRSEWIIQRGGNPEDIDQRYVEDKERETELGLIFDTNAEVVSRSGVVQSSDPEAILNDELRQENISITKPPGVNDEEN